MGRLGPAGGRQRRPGHLIECGAQATGGLWHEWDELPDLAGIGYPIAEVAADGSCVITKPEGTGGLVSVGTVTEQLLYEIDDPARYRTPDVDVDFTTLRVDEQGPDRVAVRGATGRPPSDRLKLAIVYRDGWTASGMLAVVGRDAEAKARAAGAMRPRARPPGGVRARRFAGGVPRRRRRRAGRASARREPRGKWSCASRSATRTPGRRAVLPRARPAGHLRPAGDRRLCGRPARRRGRRSATGRPSCPASLVEADRSRSAPPRNGAASSIATVSESLINEGD